MSLGIVDFVNIKDRWILTWEKVIGDFQPLRGHLGTFP